MLYMMCAHRGCYHFVEPNSAYDDDPETYAEFVHLDDGDKEHDHDARPGRSATLDEWKREIPALFREFPDGKIGPNSAHFVDARALDALAKILRQDVWPSGADFLEWTASIVRGTGREL